MSNNMKVSIRCYIRQIKGQEMVSSCPLRYGQQIVLFTGDDKLHLGGLLYWSCPLSNTYEFTEEFQVAANIWTRPMCINTQTMLIY
jgi:hypothetical protein